MKLWNLTLHEQGPAEIAIATAAGFDFDPTPRGVVVQPGQAGLNDAVTAIARVLGEAVAAKAAVLVGGHTLSLAGALVALREEELPSLVSFDTERQRDEHDRFVFRPVGVTMWPPQRTAGDRTKARL